MEFSDVVRKRKMVRAFEDRPVPESALDRILRNALRGPSAGFSQGFEFLVLEGKEQTARYWAATIDPDRDHVFPWPDLLKAPVLVVCLSHKLAYLRRYAEPDKGWTDMDEARWPVPYWDIDTGMAAMLMLLTAVDEGLGACFFGAPRDHVRAAFGIPEEYTPIGTIAIGYAAQHDRPSRSVPGRRRAATSSLHRGRW
jgi:nitroreductase